MRFTKLVFIAIVIATPLAWWLMQHWLAGFAYHIEIKWWLLVAAVSFQAVQAAVANPVESLRNE